MFSGPYRLLGMILSISGVILAPVFYLIIGSPPLAAAAISAVILGCTCLVLGFSRADISPETSRILLQTGIENTSALLEELGISNKAIYIPSKMRDGKAQALIPLDDHVEPLLIRDRLPGRLIVRFGQNPGQMAIAVTTNGSLALKLLKNPPGPSTAEIETALNTILVGTMDLATRAGLNSIDTRYIVEVSGVKTAGEQNSYYNSLGSPVASIAATVTSEALNKPVRILAEKTQGNTLKIELEVLL